jgi:hypothetical protein
MADAHVVTGLKAKRAAIFREIARLEGVIERHRADLVVLATAIAIVTGKPVESASEPPSRKRLFQRGEIGQLVFGILRRSERPLSTAEIAAMAVPNADTERQKAILKSVGKSLAKFRRQGHVLGERRGNLTWWWLPD